MNRISYFLLVLPCATLVATGQDLPQIVAKLAAAETIDDEAIGIAGQKSDNYRAYEQLRAVATTPQLRELLAHERPVVRGYAARALAEGEGTVDWPALLVLHLADTAQVKTFEGCCLSDHNFGDYLFDLVREHGLLRDEQWLDLGEALVRKKSPLYAREWALRTQRMRDGMLHEIRELARNGDRPAAIALARYAVEKDVPVLIEHLRQPEPFDDNCHFLAAEISRAPALLPALLALEGAAVERLTRDNPYRLRFWLMAIAAHKSPPAADFLAKFLRTPIADPQKQKNLRETYRDVLAPYATDAVFASLRVELAR